MSQAVLTAPLPALAEVIDSRFLTISSEMTLQAVALLMGSVGATCNCSAVGASPIWTPAAVRYGVVLEGSQLVGLLTQHDLVHLTATGVDFATVQVAEVLRPCPTRLTLPSQHTLLSVLSLLCQEQVTVLPVLDSGHTVVGVITHESIRQVLQPAHFLQWQRISEHMTTEVLQASLDTSLAEVIRQMDACSVSCVVMTEHVQDNVYPLGMITERDVVQFLALGLNLATTQAQVVMSQPVFEVSPTDSLWTAHQQMIQRHLRRLAVCDRTGHLVGLITQAQLLQALNPTEVLGVVEGLQQTVEAQTAKLQTLNERLQQEIEQRQQIETEQQAALIHQAHLYQQVAAELTKRRQVEQQIYFQARLLAAVEQAVIATDLEGKIIYWNPAAETVYGWSSEAVLGRQIADVTLVADSHAEAAKVMRQLQVRESWAGEFQVRRRDGSIFWAAVTNAPICDESGQLIGIVSVSNDISNRKAAEIRLQESEAILRSFFDSAPIMMGVVELLEDDILHISDNAVTASLFGLTPDAMRHRRASSLGVPPNILQMWMAYYRQAEQTQLPVSFEYRHAVDGCDRWLSATVVNILQTVDCSRFAYLVEDITQRRHTEARIQEQAALIDIATDAILVRDLDNRILFWSHGAERMYGWQHQDVVGKNLDNILNPEYSPQLHAAWQQILAQGKWQGELVKQTRTGVKRVIESRWTLVRDKAGQPQSILSVDTDITDKKTLEAQFLRAQRLESLGTLAGGIAHDLNNMLTPILASAMLLPMLLPDVDERTQELLDILIKSTERGAALVKQVLTFARGANGKQSILSMKDLVAEIEPLLKSTFPKAINISTVIAPDLWSIQGDETHLHQVLMNLCVNARDAMPDGGTLTILAQNIRLDEAANQLSPDTQIGPYVVVTVTDTGTGMPPEVLDKIFDPFFTTKQPGQGTGLGLSTVVGIIKGYGGFTQVTSQISQGTQFSVYLPATNADIIPTTNRPALPHGQGQLILVVDDEASIRETVSAVLEVYNYRVLTARDGAEAVAVYTDHQQVIDVVLMDMMMPKMDGACSIRALQAINSRVKVVATSGLLASEARTGDVEPRPLAFLSKPYTHESLIKTLNHVLTQAPS
ncbi:MAG: PAS domain S-box protein [Cyanobacteria bacterium J06629_9]